MNIGSFKDITDEKRQMSKYFEILKLQQKLALQQGDANKQAYTSTGEFQPTAVAGTQYQSIEQEIQDNSLQTQKALSNLQNIFKYPKDAKTTLDMILENHSPALFNQVLPEFMTELKGVKDITPSYFAEQFDRFITIKKSRGDNLVQIGVNDDKAKILAVQKADAIEKYLKSMPEYQEFPALVKNRIKFVLKESINTEEGQNMLTELKNKIDASRSEVLEENASEIENNIRNREEQWIENKIIEIESEGGIVLKTPVVPIGIRKQFQKEEEQRVYDEATREKRQEIYSQLGLKRLTETVKKIKAGLKKRKEEKLQEGIPRETLKQLQEQYVEETQQKLQYEQDLQDYKDAKDDYDQKLEQNKQFVSQMENFFKDEKISFNPKTRKISSKGRTREELFQTAIKIVQPITKKEVNAIKNLNVKGLDRLIKDEIKKEYYLNYTKLGNPPRPPKPPVIPKGMRRRRGSFLENPMLYSVQEIEENPMLYSVQEIPQYGIPGEQKSELESKEEYESRLPLSLSRQSSGRAQMSPYFVGSMSMSPEEGPGNLPVVSKREVDRLVGLIDENRMLSEADIKKVANIIGESYDSVSLRAQSVDTSDQRYLKQRLQSARVRGGAIRKKKVVLGGLLPGLLSVIQEEPKKRGRPKTKVTQPTSPKPRGRPKTKVAQPTVPKPRGRPVKKLEKKIKIVGINK